MILIATRDDETACARCRGPREMGGPDSDQFKGYTPTSLMCGIGAVCDTLFSRPLITGNQVILALLNASWCVCILVPYQGPLSVSKYLAVGQQCSHLYSPRTGRLPEKTIRIRSEVKCIKGDTIIQFGPCASYLWSISRDGFVVTFFLAILFGSRTIADPGSACLWCHSRWLTARCGNGVDWRTSSDQYDSPVLTPSTANEPST